MDNQEKMTNEKKECPCCDRHCPADKLHCSKGKEYFGISAKEGNREKEYRRDCGEERGRNHGGFHGRNRGEGHGKNQEEGHRRHYGENGASQIDESMMDAKELSLVLLRQCGHFLHHNQKEMDSARMFEAITEEEQNQLNFILKKCLAEWQ